MRKELFYNPALLLERIAEASFDQRRMSKLKGSIASGLTSSQITSLEFIELAARNTAIKTIFDLGANIGSWTLMAKALIPEATVHGFEPIPLYQEGYLASVKNLNKVTLHRVGAGAENKNAKFNFSGHSSSFLEVHENLLKMFPNEKKTGEINVEMVRLDDFVRSQNLPYPDLMKLDVEGYEMEALKGAPKCMKHCSYIILEVSFLERHIGQVLFHDLVYFMAQHDFTIHAFPCKMPLGQPLYMTDVLFKNSALKHLP